MNYTFSFFNVFLMYLSSKNPDCPHILYHEDVEAACCQKEIVDMHNRQRTNVASLAPAKNLTDMKWDAELARKAQEIAKGCKFKYEPVEESRFQTSQNMYLKCSNSDDILSNWTQAIQHWFREDKVRPNYALITEETGQLMWRKLHTQLIGCGYSNYKIKKEDFLLEKEVEVHVTNSGNDFCQIYVCVYGPF